MYGCVCTCDLGWLFLEIPSFPYLAYLSTGKPQLLVLELYLPDLFADCVIDGSFIIVCILFAIFVHERPLMDGTMAKTNLNAFWVVIGTGLR